MSGPVAPPEPPPIPGVRRSFVTARGVRFHVTEAGDPDGRPLLLLHGWPQHHYVWHDLLADPPAGMRVIAPDLPGYGWSGPAPHRWAKQDVADDLTALMDELGLERWLLAGHDWGGWIGHLVVLDHPDRVAGYLAMNIAHLWNGPRQALPHLWRLLQYQPPIATFGVPLHRRGIAPRMALTLGSGRTMPADQVAIYADRFRDPVCARAATDTYRTFLLRELPANAVRGPEKRRTSVPIRTLFGAEDKAVARGLAAKETALADDYEVEYVPGISHFIVEERPDLVRLRLLQLAAKVGWA